MALDPEIVESLARLEAAGASGAAVPASEPPSQRAAVAEWVRARGWRHGSTPSPPSTVLALAYAQYARGQGWALAELSPARLGHHLLALGWRRWHSEGRRGFRVDRETADALWALAPPGVPRYKPRPKRRATRRGPRKQRVAFWPLNPKARPLVDTLGRVWPHARAVKLAGVGCAVAVQRAASRGWGAAGCLWRFLAPHEVAHVPRDARAGDTVPALAWGRTSTGSAGGRTPHPCPRCGAPPSHGVDSPPHLGGTPPTPHSPPTPSMGPTRGGSPPHTF